MDTNRCHRAGGCALEARRTAIALPDELQESEGPCTNQALRAVCGSSGFFLLIIARADVPWSAVWRGSRRSMDSNRCNRASGCALEARRMAIAMSDELQESVGPGTNRAVRAVCGSSAEFLKIIARADVPWSPVEWRLPCQMNCRKGGCRACTAVCGRSMIFLQTIAQVNMP